MGVEQRVNEEQKEKWYNSFTREQLVERCEYLQRSCERKEDSIMELEMEIADLESIIEEVRELRKHLSNKYYELAEEVDIGVIIENIDRILDKENNNEDN